MKKLIFIAIFFIFYTISTCLQAQDTPDLNNPDIPEMDLKGCDPKVNVCSYTAKTAMELFNFFKACNTLVNIKVSMPMEDTTVVNITADPNNFCMFTIDGFKPTNVNKAPMSISCSLSKDEVNQMTENGASIVNDFFNTKSKQKNLMQSNFKVLIDCMKSKSK